MAFAGSQRKPDPKETKNPFRKWVISSLAVIGILITGGWVFKQFVIPKMPEPPLFHRFFPPMQPQQMIGVLQTQTVGEVETLMLVDEKTGTCFVLEPGQIFDATEGKLVKLKPWLEPGVKVSVKGQVSDRPETKNWGPVFELDDLDVVWHQVKGTIVSVKDGEILLKEADSGKKIRLDLSKVPAEDAKALQPYFQPGKNAEWQGLYASGGMFFRPRTFYVFNRVGAEKEKQTQAEGKAQENSEKGK